MRVRAANSGSPGKTKEPSNKAERRSPTSVALHTDTSAAFNGRPVRSVIIDGQRWYVQNDVCEILEIKNPRDAAERLDDDEHRLAKVHTAGGAQDLTLVSRNGTFHLTFMSHSPAAKQFRRWVTHQVLPSIADTGSYSFDLASRLTIDTDQALSAADKALLAITRRPGRYLVRHEAGKPIHLAEQPYDAVLSDIAECELRALIAAALLIRSLWTGVKHSRGLAGVEPLMDPLETRLDDAIFLNASLADTFPIWNRMSGEPAA